MTFSLLLAAVFAAWSLAVTLPAQAAPTETIELSAITPGCDAPFKFDAGTGTCVGDDAALDELKKDDCVAPGLTWNGISCKADPEKKKAFPTPGCGSKLPDLAYNPAKKECHVVRTVPRSALADYVGDCFKVVAVPEPNALNVPLGTHLEVLSQRLIGAEDKELTLGVAQASYMLPFSKLTWGCGDTKGTIKVINASKLIEVGAHRYGWTYGVLTMPFKYYPGDKAITASGLALGPYAGRRWGSPGAATTVALAATVGSVKGEVRDAQGNITSTPDLTAFSFAAGFMWDISKNTTTKAFKIGAFIGRDWVNTDKVIQYPHSGKTWAAFQIGYDFTDN
jgi:hypothetical protein